MSFICMFERNKKKYLVFLFSFNIRNLASTSKFDLQEESYLCQFISKKLTPASTAVRTSV